MLNRCQSKHTGRATTTPNDCQVPLYTHMLSYMCMSTRLMKQTLRINIVCLHYNYWSNRTVQKVLTKVYIVTNNSKMQTFLSIEPYLDEDVFMTSVWKELIMSRDSIAQMHGAVSFCSCVTHTHTERRHVNTHPQWMSHLLQVEQTC